MFPRTWEEFGTLVEEDKVLIVYGKGDLRGNDVQVIADKAAKQFDFAMSADILPAQQTSYQPQFAPLPDEDEIDEETGEYLQPEPEPAPPPREPVVMGATSGANVIAIPRLEPQYSNEEPTDLPPISDEDAPPDDLLDWDTPPVPPAKAKKYDNVVRLDETTNRLVAPPAKAAVPVKKGRRLIIQVERTWDSRRDRRRLSDIHQMLSVYSRDKPDDRHCDQFCIIFVDNENQELKMEFPRLYIHIHDSLKEQVLMREGVIDIYEE
jgi:hypothetical protein